MVYIRSLRPPQNSISATSLPPRHHSATATREAVVANYNITSQTHEAHIILYRIPLMLALVTSVPSILRIICPAARSFSQSATSTNRYHRPQLLHHQTSNPLYRLTSLAANMTPTTSTTSTNPTRSLLIIGLAPTSSPAAKYNTTTLPPILAAQESLATSRSWHMRIETLDYPAQPLPALLTQVRQAVSEREWDVVGIGGGLRANLDKGMTEVFEGVVGVVMGEWMRRAREGKGKVGVLGFPTSPETLVLEAEETVERSKRWEG